MDIRSTCLTLMLLGVSAAAADRSDIYNCYEPVRGGWHIRLSASHPPGPAEAHPRMGMVSVDHANCPNPRLHRRPLYPPADRALVFDADQLPRIERFAFRPLVLAYVEPRFLFDFYSAGGLLGHLYLGIVAADGTSKWLHEWSELDVSYVDGRMQYIISDPAFAGMSVSLECVALSDCAGAVAKVEVNGPKQSGKFVWAYGGASAFFTNYSMDAPEFKYQPAQCAKNFIRCDDTKFVLSRGFAKPDVIMDHVFAVARYFPNFKAVVEGSSSLAGKMGVGDAAAFAVSPQQLLRSARFEKPPETEGAVAVQKVPIVDGCLRGFVVVGMGHNIAKATREPEKAWKSACARNADIAARVVTHTPDAHLDAAMNMMAFATDGTWGDSAILHGAWSWRFAYLGWRGWYGSDVFGWSDRVRQCIRNHTRLSRVTKGDDEGAIGALLEHQPSVFYNMNEVFLDQVRHYFDYTGDLELMREIYPTLEGIVAWEDKRLRPAGEPLYENALNTWISDQHWYIGGQCTQASAYMLGANRFLADLAHRQGRDPAQYEKQAAAIRKAMQEKLWQPGAGTFAEYLDTRGARLLHAEPEVATLYHAAEFGVADPLQIWQMCHWAQTHLRTESTPGDGRLYWSSNWSPTIARSYTHSTYDLAYAEQLNFAIAQHLAGRSDEAWALERGCLAGIFNGPTPGGLACHAYVDGRQRSSDEFSDAISMWGRAIVEGLFGIVPKRADGFVELLPQLPMAWPTASIATPQFSYEWKNDRGRVSISWSSPIATAVHLRLPLRASAITSVSIDDRPAAHNVEAGVDCTWLIATAASARHGKIEIVYEPRDAVAPPQNVAATSPVKTKLWSPPKVDRDLSRWALIDLSSSYNASITDAMKRVHDVVKPPPSPASDVNTTYYKSHLVAPFVDPPPSDEAWRRKVGADGIAWTTDGIPFKSAKEGANIAVVTRAGAFSERLEFPVRASGRTLYLMLSGTTFAMQSHVVNLRITLRYPNGKEEPHDLVNPFDIGDCWSQYRFHDTAANGFENLGGRFGPAGSAQVKDLNQPIAVDTEAHLIAFDVADGAVLQSVCVEAVANDIIFGVMGASILK